MFVSHPDTECVVRQLEHLERMGTAAAARRTVEARRSSTDRPAGAATMRRHAGSVMVALGRRLQGVKPVGLAAPTVAGSEVTS